MARIFKNDKGFIMDMVFHKEDFELCNVPVPKRYPQSQTHVGIGYYRGKYYMTTSPFPNPRRSKLQVYTNEIIRRITFGYVSFLYRGEDFENPCLYVEDKRDIFGIPISFKLVGKKPLMGKPIDKYGFGSYCSDPDLYINNELFHILNRTSVRKELVGNPKEIYETEIHLILGNVSSGSFSIKEIRTIFKGQDTSPCLIWFNEKYLYFYLNTNSYNDGSPCESLSIRESSDLMNWSKTMNVSLNKGSYEPWHMSVFKYNNKLFSIIACVKSGVGHRCWQMLGEFNDSLTALKIYQTPLTDYQSYRGAAIVREDGEFILYSPTVREIIKGGKSVDGREIIMAHMPFDQLLRKVRENEV